MKNAVKITSSHRGQVLQTALCSQAAECVLFPVITCLSYISITSFNPYNYPHTAKTTRSTTPEAKTKKQGQALLGLLFTLPWLSSSGDMQPRTMTHSWGGCPSSHRTLHQIRFQTNLFNEEFKQQTFPTIPNSSSPSPCVRKRRQVLSTTRVCSDLIKLSKTKIFSRAYLPVCLWRIEPNLSTKTVEPRLGRKHSPQDTQVSNGPPHHHLASIRLLWHKLRINKESMSD